MLRLSLAVPLDLLSAASVSAQPTRQAIVPIASWTLTYWGADPANRSLVLRCAAQATARYPAPVKFIVSHYTPANYPERAWLLNADNEDRPENSRLEWVSYDSGGYRARYGSIRCEAHREAFIATRTNRDRKQEEYVRASVEIPSIVNDKDPIEVAKDAARKGIPMEWRISHPWSTVILYVAVDRNSIMASCGRTDFVGGGPESLSQAQISNARLHIHQASEALGAESEELPCTDWQGRAAADRSGV